MSGLLQAPLNERSSYAQPYQGLSYPLRGTGNVLHLQLLNTKVYGAFAQKVSVLKSIGEYRERSYH